MQDRIDWDKEMLKDIENKEKRRLKNKMNVKNRRLKQKKKFENLEKENIVLKNEMDKIREKIREICTEEQTKLILFS